MPSDAQYYSSPKLARKPIVITGNKSKAAGMALLLGAAMALTVLGTVLAGRIGLAFVSLFVVSVLVFILRGEPVAATAVFFGYAALEGMFKYMSGFSPLIYIINPLMLGAILVGWRMRLAMQDKKPLTVPLQALIITFLFWGLLETFNPHGKGPLTGVTTLCLYYALPVSLLIIGYNTIRSVTQVNLFLYAVIAASSVVSACAILQFIMGRPWTEIHFPGYEHIVQGDWFIVGTHGAPTIGSFKPASTTPMGGGGSVWAQWGATLSLGLLFSPKVQPGTRAALCVCLLLDVICLFISGVRLMLTLTVFNAIVFIIVRSRSLKDMGRSFASLIAVAIISSLAFTASQTLSGGIIGARYASTAQDPATRFQHDRGGNLVNVSGFFLNFPLGAGYQMELGRATTYAPNTDPAMKARNGETEFGSIAGDMGIPGMLLLYSIVFGILVQGWHRLRRLKDPYLRNVGALLFAALSGYIPGSFSGPVLQNAPYFWFVAAVLLALPLVEKRERERKSLTSADQVSAS